MEFVLRREFDEISPCEHSSQGVHIYLLVQGKAICNAFDSSLFVLPNDLLFFPTAIPYQFSLQKGSEVLYCYCSYDFMKRVNQVPMMKTNFHYWCSNAGVYHQNFMTLTKEMTKEILAFTNYFETKSIEKQFFIMIRFLTMVCTTLQKSSLYNLSQVESVLTRQVLNYIDIHLSDKLSLESVAAAHYVSVSKLQRAFQTDVQQSLSSYILNRRLEEAKRCIIYEKNVTKAWEQSGFTEHSNFSKVFKAAFGISPRIYCEQFNQRKEEFDESGAL